MMTHSLNSLRCNEWSSAFIDGFRWQEDRALELFSALSENTSCSRLIFQNATLNENIGHAFTQAMIQNRSLRVANLRNLSSFQGGFYRVPSSMFSQHDGLESLSLIRVRLDSEACESLGVLLQKRSSLRSISLEEIEIDPEGIASLLEGIAMACSLTTLKFGKLDWTKEDIQRLLKAVSSNKTITKLSLENLKLNAAHALDIANLLQENSSVEQLSLRRNLLDHEALQLLFSRGLNQTLQNLFLSRNPLGEAGAFLISKLLATSNILQEICLVDTEMNGHGCMEIARSLRFNSGLHVLSLNENNMEECGEAILESLQEHNVHLQQITGHFPSNQTWKQVDFYLRANRANRRFLHVDSIQRPHLPLIFQGATSQPDVLFNFIRSSGNHLFETALKPKAVAAKRPRMVASSLLLSKLKDMTALPIVSRSTAIPRRMAPPSA